MAMRPAGQVAQLGGWQSRKMLKMKSKGGPRLALPKSRKKKKKEKVKVKRRGKQMDERRGGRLLLGGCMEAPSLALGFKESQ
jgi:hypothetical protein